MADQYVIDTSLFDEAELTASSEVPLPAGQIGNPLPCYPLAIRMEVMGPTPPGEGRTLAVRSLAPLLYSCTGQECSYVRVEWQL